MILLYGRVDDGPTARILEALQYRNEPYVLLDQRAVLHDGVALELTGRGVSGRLFAGGAVHRLEEFRAVFARPLNVDLHGADATAQANAHLQHDLLMQWLDVAPALVVNRPGAMQSNASKPLQCQLIAAAGFAVPETLVTDNEDDARAFWREHGRIIYKSTSGIRSIVRELDDVSARRLALVAALPTQFQAFVPGVDIRAHVVGSRVLAAEIRTSAMDYRYAERDGAAPEFAAVELPDAVAERCVGLAGALGLPLAGIDLRRRPDGEYVCFEVNPMPAYTYFESNTGLGITDAIVRLLVGDKEQPNGPGNRESHVDCWQDPFSQAAFEP